MKNLLLASAALALLALSAAADDAPVATPAEDPPAAEQPPAEAAAAAAAAAPPPPSKLPFSKALLAARPWSFGATVAPVLYGTALAYAAEDAFSAPLLVLTLVTTLGVHARSYSLWHTFRTRRVK